LAAMAHLVARRTWADCFVALALTLSAVAIALGCYDGTARDATVLLPLLALALARFAVAFPGQVRMTNDSEKCRRSGGRRLRYVLAVSVCFGYAMTGLVGTASVCFAHREASYHRMASLIRRELKPHEAVVGPLVFWQALLDRDYFVWPSPFARKGSPGDVRLMTDLLQRKPDVLIQATGGFGSTGGLGPRRQDFDSTPARLFVDSVLQARGTLRAEIPSRDFGPLRIWSLRWQANEGDCRAPE